MNQVNDTRFMTQEEFAAEFTELDLERAHYKAAGLPFLVKENTVYADTSDNHTIIFGATGSKKTRLLVMPSVELLCRAGESFIVTDPKGEVYQRTAERARKAGYQVQCLNLRDVTNSKSRNPLELPYRYYHEGKKSKAMVMVAQLVAMIVPDENEKDRFWVDSSRNIITGFILLLMEHVEDASDCNFQNLMELWESYLGNKKAFFEKVKTESNKTIFRKLSCLDNSSPTTVGSMESYVSSSFNRIAINEDVLKLISQNGISLKNITGDKTAIYLVVPDENTTYHFIASVFLAQFYDVLIEKAHEREDNRLPIRVNFIVDEFANLPKIDNMDSMITAARSRNIRMFLVVQSMKQLDYRYAEYAEVICSNCNNWVYLYSKEYDLLQQISQLCGEKIYDDGGKIPLISPFELQHLSKEKGEALVLSGRNFPCIVNLRDIDDYDF